MKNLRLIPDIHRQQPIVKASFATPLLDNGTDIRFIQELLGHNSTKTTQRYTQVLTQEIGNIVNPLDSYYQKKSGAIHTIMGGIFGGLSGAAAACGNSGGGSKCPPCCYHKMEPCEEQQTCSDEGE